MQGFEGKVQFVWQVADLLRGDYKPAECRGAILPLLVLRRLDAVLEETKPQVLARAEQLRGVTDNPDLSDDEDVQQRAADNTEEQFSLTIKKDDIAGALFQNQESSNKLLKALLENENFADTVQKIISTETWKAARRKHSVLAGHER